MSDTEQQQQQPHFNIEKIYIKDLSIETPNAPQIFFENQQPEIEIKLNTEAKGFENGLFDVVLTVTVTAKLGDKTVFLVEAGQAGIFQLRNIPEQDLEPILAVACPNILFPYARETISDSVNRAGFPPLLLAPVNFEGLYQQRLLAQKQAAGEVSLQ